MDKNILAAIIGLDETKALVVIEPFHYPGNRNRSGRIRGAALRARRITEIRATEEPVPPLRRCQPQGPA